MKQDHGSRPTAERERLERRAADRIADTFRSAGWTVSRPRAAGSPDLLLRRGGRTYAVDIKAAAGRARRPLLRALLADAILQARAHAREEGGAEPLPVLMTESISDTIARELGEYVDRVSEGTPWGVLDDRGRLELHGPGLDSVESSPGERPARKARRREEPREGARPFTDLGQWISKVLLAPKIPEGWMRAPRRPIRSVADLAAAAGVSVPSASRILVALEDAGFASRESGVVELRRLESLFQSWRTAAQRPARERFARFLLPADEPHAQLQRALAERSRSASSQGGRACLGLFSACAELGLGIVRGAPVHLLLEDPSDAALEALGLHAVPRHEAEVVVRRPAFPEAAFRARVEVRGAPVADALQCWLDVSHHPARGAEQAAEIASRLGIPELAP